MVVNAQIIDSTKNIYSTNNISELRNLIGLELLAIPRVNSSNSINYPGVSYFKDGNYVEMKNFSDYEYYISNKKFKIDDIKENGLFTDFYLSNQSDKVKWEKSPMTLSEKPFISVPFFEFVKKKVEKKRFIYATRSNQYDNVTSLYDYSENDIYTNTFFGFKDPDNEFSRFMKPVFIADSRSEKNKEFIISDFDYSKFYNTSEYDEMFAKNKSEKTVRESKIYKKYGREIGERILMGEVWIGMTRELLFESKGKPTKIGITTETADMYSVQYIYESRLFGTELIYVENGKVTAIQSY